MTWRAFPLRGQARASAYAAGREPLRFAHCDSGQTLDHKVVLLRTSSRIRHPIEDLEVTGTAGTIAGVFDPIDPDGRRGSVAEHVALRPAADIAAKLDLLYGVHWAAREYQLRGVPEEWPEQLVPGAI